MEEPDAHECARCGALILPVGSEVWDTSTGRYVPFHPFPCQEAS